MTPSIVETGTQQHIFFDILRRKKGMALKLCPQMEYQIKNIFIKKSCGKCAPKASTRPVYNFGK